jgi:hypothetical protein
MMSDTERLVLERAIDDEQFRLLLFSQPEEALAGYDLTEEERNRLSGLNQENFDEFAGPLDPRSTKGVWKPGIG